MKRSHDRPDRRCAGFTFIEVLVAVTLLSIAAISMLPLMTGALKGYAHNRMTEAAEEIASARLDEAKALPYEVRFPSGTNKGLIDSSKTQLGTVGGNPVGSLPLTETQTRGGTAFTVLTRVYWVEEHTAGTDTKRVTVQVQAISPFSRRLTTFATMETLVAKEGEPALVDSGNILIRTFRLASPQPDVPITIKRVDITSPTQPDINDVADSDGQVLYGELPVAAQYSIKLTAASTTLMLKPLTVTANATAQGSATTESTLMNWDGTQLQTIGKWADAPVNLNVDYPANFTLTLLDDLGGTVNPSPGTPFTSADYLWASLRPLPDDGSFVAGDDALTGHLDVIRRVTTLPTLNVWPQFQYDLKIGKVTFSGTPTKPHWVGNCFRLSVYPAQWDGAVGSSTAVAAIAHTLTVRWAKPTIAVTKTSDGSAVTTNVGILRTAGVTISPSPLTGGVMWLTPGTSITDSGGTVHPAATPFAVTAPLNLPGQTAARTVVFTAQRKNGASDALLDSLVSDAFTIRWN